MRFIPREEKFFDFFEELADKIEVGGKLFLEMAESGVYSEPQVTRLKEIEHEADIITHRTYEKMHTTFLTPLDREDIHSLVNKMDSILDMTEAAAARIFLYRVKKPSAELIEQARILNEAIGKVKTIIHALRDMKNAPLILQTSVEINTLENAGDVILQSDDGASVRERTGCPRADQVEGDPRADRRGDRRLRRRLQYRGRDRPEKWLIWHWSSSSS